MIIFRIVEQVEARREHVDPRGMRVAFQQQRIDVEIGRAVGREAEIHIAEMLVRQRAQISVIPVCVRPQRHDRHHLPHAHHREMIRQRHAAQVEQAPHHRHAQDRTRAMGEEQHLVPRFIQFVGHAPGKGIEPRVQRVARSASGERVVIIGKTQQPWHDQLVEPFARRHGADADPRQRRRPEWQHAPQQQSGEQREQQRDHHRQKGWITDGQHRTGAQRLHPLELHETAMADIGGDGAEGERERVANPHLADQILPAEKFIVGLDPGLFIVDRPDRRDD